MTLEWITHWCNLIFILPFGLGLLYLGLYTISGWTFGETDSDAGVDHAVDAHIDMDGHLDVDHDVSHDIHTDVDSDADAHGDTGSHGDTASHASPSTFLSALNWVGVGRVPVSLVLMILMLSWGVIGFAAMQLQRGSAIPQSVAIALAAAALGSTCITHLVSSILGPLLFSPDSAPLRRHELLGSHGEAMYAIDSKFGMVSGHNERGELFQVACRIAEGQEPLAKGTAVELVAYTARDGMFLVAPADSENTPRRKAVKR